MGRSVDQFMADIMSVQEDVLNKANNLVVSVDGDDGTSWQANDDELGYVAESKEKVAAFKLPNNAQEWNHQILKQLHEEYDWLDAENFYVRWRSEFDGDEGYGTGVIVLQKDGKTISVPVIVKNFELQPLDMFYDVEQEELKPITKHNVEKAFYGTDITDKLVDKDKNNLSKKVVDNVFAPRLSKYVHASANPEMLDKIDILDEDMADFYARIKEAGVLVTANHNEEFKKVAKALINKETIESDDIFATGQEKIASLLLSPDEEKGYRMDWIEKGEHHTKVASYYNTYKFLEKKFGMDKTACDKKIKTVDEGRNTAIRRTKVASMMEGEEPEFSRLTSAGMIQAMTPEGDFVEGYGIPVVLQMTDGMPSGMELMVDKDRRIMALENGIVGKPIRKGESIFDITKKNLMDIPRRNEVISFMWRDRRFGDFVALEPGKLLSYQQIKGVGDLYTIFTTFGTIVNVLQMKNVVKSDFSKNNQYDAIIIPEDSARVLKKEEYTPLVEKTSSIKRQLLKEATAVEGNYFRETNEFKLKSNGQIKIASPRETITHLINEGVSHHHASKFLEKTAKQGKSTLYIKYPKLEKKASIKEAMSVLMDDLKSIRKEFDLVKLASQITEPDTLDKLLSLNFVNNKNLALFYKALPKYKEVVQSLSSLVLAARIGEIGIEESVVVDAMQALQQLVEKMEGYQFEEV